MNILAIETSCDETGVAILKCEGNAQSPSFKVLSNQLISQILAHREYGGVYPNLAKRLHGENLIPLLRKAMEEAGMLFEESVIEKTPNGLQGLEVILEREKNLYTQFLDFIPGIKKPNIDLITVTQGPGLEPALWVGVNFAKALSMIWDIPLLPVNHMEGHVASVLYEDDRPVVFPALVLLVSGGHTELVLARNWGEYQLLGRTRDDAVGEAFDKVGRILGLPYPGGPEISKLAQQARDKNLEPSTVLPRPMIDSGDYDFSFSGLKTAVLYIVKEKSELTPELTLELALEFENAVVDVLAAKTKKALKEYNPKTLIVAGGVAANKTLRNRMKEIDSAALRIPHRDVTGDNAVMIGMAGYLSYLREGFSAPSPELQARGGLSIATE